MNLELSRFRSGGRLWVWLVAVTLLVGCSKPVLRRYYTITVPAAPVAGESRYPVDLWVKEVEVASVYNRPQIVYRYSLNELQYFNQHNWADRPARMVSQLLLEAVTNAGLFRSVVDRLGATQPKYVFESTVNAIEELDGGDVWFAHLAMSMRISRFEDNKIMWQYNFDEKRPLNRQEVGLIVRAMSEIFQEQMGIALSQIDAVLGGKPMPKLPEKSAAVVLGTATAGDIPGAGAAAAISATTSSTPAAPASGASDAPTAPVGTAAVNGTSIPATTSTAASVTTSVPASTGHGEKDGPPERSAGKNVLVRPGVVVPAPTEGVAANSGSGRDWKQSSQFYSDPTTIPPGKGAVFLPALSQEPDREPPVQLFRDGILIANGTMGRRITLIPGKYDVYFGSGTLSQRQSREVTVVEAKTTIVQPDWSTLDVSVVDEKFIPFRGSYELIRMDDREYMGQAYGADEELGEQTMVWVLRPGLYKIIQSGSNYRARTNFATVQLQAGTLVPFTLVQDTTTRNFLGAGVSEYDSGQGRNKKWSVRSSLGGNILLLNRTATYSQQDGSGLSGTVYADNLLRYSSDPHLWTTRLEVEEGLNLQSRINPDTGVPNTLLDRPIQSVQDDRIYLNSIYIYRLLSWAGPYIRIGGESSLLNHVYNFEPSTIVELQDADGKATGLVGQSRDGSPGQGISLLPLSGPLAPLSLKQGVGVNFRVVHNTVLDIDLRTGFGSRQYLTRGRRVLVASDLPSNLAVIYPDEGNRPSKAFKLASDSAVAGPEITVVAGGRFTRYVQVTSEFDSIVPLQGIDQTQFSWRTSASLRLSSYASLTYTLDLERQPNLRAEQPLSTVQGLQLRFYYAPW